MLKGRQRMLPKTVEQLPNQATSIPESRVALLEERPDGLLPTPVWLAEDQQPTVESANTKVFLQKGFGLIVAKCEVCEESERSIAFPDIEQAAHVRLPEGDHLLSARL